MTPERLAEIKERAAKASPGPWHYRKWGGDYGVSVLTRTHEHISATSGWTRNEARFIAHARQDVPDLVAEVERLRLALKNIANVLGPLGQCDEFFCSNDCEGCRTEMAETLSLAEAALNG